MHPRRAALRRDRAGNLSILLQPLHAQSSEGSSKDLCVFPAKALFPRGSQALGKRKPVHANRKPRMWSLPFGPDRSIEKARERGRET